MFGISFKKLSIYSQYNSYLPKRNENNMFHKDSGINVHSSTIYNSPKMETTQMNIADTNNGILFGYKKELNTEIYYNKDDP